MLFDPARQEPAGGWSDRLANVTGENRVEGKRPTLCTGCTFRRQDLAVGPNGTSLFLTRLAGGAASGDQAWRRKSSGRAGASLGDSCPSVFKRYGPIEDESAGT